MGTGASPTIKSLLILETVAESGGATAQELSDRLGISLATVYRLAQTLVQADYLVHLREEKRFELGYKLHRLSSALHQQIGVSPRIRMLVDGLHAKADAAAYFSVYRGTDVVVAYVADSPQAPRIRAMSFGFHEATHATAFGKIILGGMTAEQRDQFLAAHGMPAFTPSTITERSELDRQLESVRLQGIAWEHEEFVPGHTCAAVGVRSPQGEVIGAVAVSVLTPTLGKRAPLLERLLHEAAARASRYLRQGR